MPDDAPPGPSTQASAPQAPSRLAREDATNFGTRTLAALDRHDVLIVAAEAPGGVSLGLYHDDEAVVGFERPDQAAFDHLATCLWSEAD